MGTWKKWFKYITPDYISVYALGEGGGSNDAQNKFPTV